MYSEMETEKNEDHEAQSFVIFIFWPARLIGSREFADSDL